MKKINWKSAGLTVAGLLAVIVSKIIDDKTRENELAEMKEEITNDLIQRQNQVKES